MSDPYDLLRTAVPIMERLVDQGDSMARAWLSAYGELPGAELSEEEVRVLRYSELRAHHPEIAERLQRDAYLEPIQSMSGPWRNREAVTYWRRNERGNAALQLRPESSE